MSAARFKWDAHVCLPLSVDTDVSDLLAYRRAGVDFISLNIGMCMNPPAQISAVISHFAAAISTTEGLKLVDSTADLEPGVTGVAFDLEGGRPLQGRAEAVAEFHALGVRMMHLAYNRNNKVAGGCHDAPMALTALGHEVVAEANRIGVLLDLSHTGTQSSFDIIAASSAPVVFSHANASALYNHARNISDAQMRAVAETGGVVCPTGVGKFMGLDRAPTAQDMLPYIDHALATVGEEHVGLGSDMWFAQAGIDETPPPDPVTGQGFDPHYWWPEAFGYDHNGSAIGGGYLAPEQWSVLPDLLDTRFGPRIADKVLGENMRRVAAAVWC
ncbi:MAG: peptidase M19 [Kiloniella sp.]|nr:peptidase M19 [Kiloniella sp.]